jgi:hypothetical protein
LYLLVEMLQVLAAMLEAEGDEEEGKLTNVLR